MEFYTILQWFCYSAFGINKSLAFDIIYHVSNENVDVIHVSVLNTPEAAVIHS